MTEGNCHFCDETQRLQTHHIVPRRFDGSDAEENLVTVCPTCHDKLEALYNKRFYDAVGVVKDSEESLPCGKEGCASTDTERYENEDVVVHLCDEHATCSVMPTFYTTPCTKDGFTPVDDPNGGAHLFCTNHDDCEKPKCSATAQTIVDVSGGREKRCLSHNAELETQRA